MKRLIGLWIVGLHVVNTAAAAAIGAWSVAALSAGVALLFLAFLPE